MGWTLSETLDTMYVIKAVKQAVAKHGTPGIINSDQGCQFTSKEYKDLLKSLQIRQSMDGKSRWADNIMIERWFRSLKTEEIYINEYHSPKDPGCNQKVHRQLQRETAAFRIGLRYPGLGIL
jgi:putative transposase